MEAYTGFAQVYDKFMDNIEYDKWCEYLVSILKEYGVNYGIVLDLGCGTGNITELLADKGYDMIGVDYSQEMLNMAIEKRKKTSYNGTKETNCINYIPEFEDLVTTFQLVNNYLAPGGIFVFDLKTIELYRSIGESVIAEDREDCSFIWDNYFDEEDCINEYMLSIFVKGDDNRYDKFSEEHYQRAYTVEEIKEALNLAGLEFVTVYDAFTRNEPNSESERIYVVARECQKNQVSK